MQPSLEVTMEPTGSLVPYAGNAKEHPDWQVGQIVESIERFGFDDPIAVWHDADGNPVIVEGHGRLLAARELGMERVPTISLDHLDDDARRAYTLVHNQLTMDTGFDADALAAELEALSGSGIEMGDFGLGDAIGLPDKLESLDGITEDEPLDEPAEHGCECGQVWQLGEHRLMCGDSTDADDVSSLMGDDVADLLLTDPPYNVDYTGCTDDHLKIANDSFESERAFSAFLAQALRAAHGVMRGGGAFYVFYAESHIRAILDALDAADMRQRQTLVWVKNHFSLGHQDYQHRYEPCVYGWLDGKRYFAPTRSESTVIDDTMDVDHMSKADLKDALRSILDGAQTDAVFCDKPAVNDIHPTMKPVALFARLMRNSTRPGDVVLDPFGGSGTTLVAAEQLGRRARLIELDPRYCDAIIDRYERLAGGEARLVP